MRMRIAGSAVAMAISTFCLAANGQSAADLAALRGLAPVTVLDKTRSGKAALDANYTVTGGIQTGLITQPGLTNFGEEQQQALRDAFITSANLAQLADGLGTTLGSAYVARAHYLDRMHGTVISDRTTALVSYALGVSEAHSNEGKFLFANLTTDGKTPASPAAKALVTGTGGIADIFGVSYGMLAGTTGADPIGNSRPFQTETSVAQFSGNDYLNIRTGNKDYNEGPIMDLVASPSYPSGHTTYGYTGALLLAVMVPERYQQMVTRGAEYGNSRIVMGAHYAMDVLGGRTLAMYDVAHLLANDPAYMGLTFGGGSPGIADFRSAIKAAQADVRQALESACGNTVKECARQDTGRMNLPRANRSFYEATQTYNLPVVYPEVAVVKEDVGKLAPEAGWLLTAAFPWITLQQADQILTDTEGPGGGFLDNGTAFGVYSRIDLYRAAGEAEAMAPAQ